MVKKILCVTRIFQTYIDDLNKYAAEHGFEVEVVEPTTREDFMKRFENNDVGIIINAFRAREMGGYTDDMIRAIAKSGVKIVIHQGTGYDNLGNIKLWKELGIQIANSPNAPASDTADMAMVLVLTALRNYNAYIASLRAHEWRGKDEFGLSVHGRTVGILGLGSIGRQVRDRCSGFPFGKIQYHQRTKLAPELEKGAVFVKDLDTILSTSDIIVVIVPYSKATHHLLSRERLLNVVKPNCVIVNVARGPIIDENALVEALDSGRVYSCGLDVFEKEPEVHPGLLANPKVSLAPHIAARTQYNLDSLELEIMENIKSFVETGKVINLVAEHR